MLSMLATVVATTDLERRAASNRDKLTKKLSYSGKLLNNWRSLVNVIDRQITNKHVPPSRLRTRMQEQGKVDKGQKQELLCSDLC